ncbi:hypothetical protein MUA04_17220 [Enterobacteriaceae bacterium H11S18]|uniref:hypothetical protein n=1 Tax=Dryocola clanedunensis TaxID=2925396 RepID=UPI0022F13F68|nr:hypothetical protein [Dryocola clanedunensis]MCT4704764.1 hypothetical protein [Dryocola clanedunensis]MCT4711915.1 hypothetical protein [Dryocola clanedunensis]
MNKRSLFCLLWFFITLNVFADSGVALPSDVQGFIDNADACEHFSGEWDNNLPKARQLDIKEALDKNCGIARRQQSELKEKYEGNQEIEKIVADYEF